MVEKLRLMAVHAHPDDESSKGAATMARYVSEGHEVMVVTCTGGEAGSILNPAMNRPDVLENMAEIRRGEMARAAEILGVQHRGPFRQNHIDRRPLHREHFFEVVHIKLAGQVIRIVEIRHDRDIALIKAQPFPQNSCGARFKHGGI